MIQILTQSSQNYSHRRALGLEVSGVCLVGFSRSHPMHHGIWWAIDPMFFSPWKHFHPVSCFCDSLIGVYVLQSVSHNLLPFPSFTLSFSNIFFLNLGNNGRLGAKALGSSWNAIGSATPLAARDALAMYRSTSLETRWLLVVWRTADGFELYKNPIYRSPNCFCNAVALLMLSLILHFFFFLNWQKYICPCHTTCFVMLKVCLFLSLCLHGKLKWYRNDCDLSPSLEAFCN